MGITQPCKRKEIMIHALTWVNPENMLSEISQTNIRTRLKDK
jgi:hypothetical protein